MEEKKFDYEGKEKLFVKITSFNEIVNYEYAQERMKQELDSLTDKDLAVIEQLNNIIQVAIKTNDEIKIMQDWNGTIEGSHYIFRYLCIGEKNCDSISYKFGNIKKSSELEKGKIIVLVPSDKIDEYLKFANDDIVIRNMKKKLKEV